MVTILTGDVVSTSEAARIAGVAPETIRAWLRCGRLQGASTPLGALIRRDDIERLAGERERVKSRRIGGSHHD